MLKFLGKVLKKRVKNPSKMTKFIENIERFYYLGNVLLWFPLLGPTFEAVFESVLVLLVRVLLVTKLAPRGSLDSVNKTGSWQLAEGES